MGLDMYINSYKKDENVIRLFEKYGQKSVNTCWHHVDNIQFCDKLVELYCDTVGIESFLVENGYSKGKNILSYAQTISYWWKELKENGTVPTPQDKLGCSSIEIDVIKIVQKLADVLQNSLSHLNMADIEKINSKTLRDIKKEDEIFYWRKKWDIHEVIESIITNEAIGNCCYVPVNEEQFSELVEHGIVSQDVVSKLDFKEYMYFYFFWY